MKFAGTELFVSAGTWDLPAEIAEGVVFVGAEGTIINVGAAAVPFTVGGDIDLVLDKTVIDAAEGNALSIVENADVKVTVVGTAELTASANAIDVHNGSALTVTGYELIAKGGAGVDSENGGSGIGGEGSIVVDGLHYLTAEGYGVNGYGIGGADATVTIKNVSKVEARGGYPQPEFVNDSKYGKSEPEGAPAIGGAVILIEGSTVNKAEGGSKAAAIGARYWLNTDITILNSTISEAFGGNASAGVGGSRYSSDISADNKQIVKIYIENSTVNAFGGQFGAGIGSGYDTHCAANASNSVNDITIVNSTINAKGGKYAAGIGTGFHAASLTGSIDDVSTINAKCGEDFYKDSYTKAQNVGYGVVDPAREYKDAVVTFTVAGTVIDAPAK